MGRILRTGARSRLEDFDEHSRLVLLRRVAEATLASAVANASQNRGISKGRDWSLARALGARRPKPFASVAGGV
jgi:hypothetical protein